MIAYFDTSALVKLLVGETGSATAEAAWHAADVRMCCSAGGTEAAAARSVKLGEWNASTSRPPTSILIDLSRIWSGISRIGADDLLCLEAAKVAVAVRTARLRRRPPGGSNRTRVPSWSPPTANSSPRPMPAGLGTVNVAI